MLPSAPSRHSCEPHDKNLMKSGLRKLGKNRASTDRLNLKARLGCRLLLAKDRAMEWSPAYSLQLLSHCWRHIWENCGSLAESCKPKWPQQLQQNLLPTQLPKLSPGVLPPVRSTLSCYKMVAKLYIPIYICIWGEKEADSWQVSRANLAAAPTEYGM